MHKGASRMAIEVFQAPVASKERCSLHTIQASELLDDPGLGGGPHGAVIGTAAAWRVFQGACATVP